MSAKRKMTDDRPALAKRPRLEMGWLQIVSPYWLRDDMAKMLELSRKYGLNVGLCDEGFMFRDSKGKRLLVREDEFYVSILVGTNFAEYCTSPVDKREIKRDDALILFEIKLQEYFGL